MRATGMPSCIATMTVSTALFEVGKLADGRGDCFREAIKSQLHFGDDAERAFRADEEARQVIAGAGLARAAAGADDAAVSGDDRQPEDVLAHRAVAHRVGARGARRRHAADRRVGAGIDREKQPGALELGVELLARDARLHAAIEVGVVHLAARGSSATGRRRRRHRGRRRAPRATCRPRTRSPECAPHGRRERSPRLPRSYAETRRCPAARRRRALRHANAARESRAS